MHASRGAPRLQVATKAPEPGQGRAAVPPRAPPAPVRAVPARWRVRFKFGRTLSPGWIEGQSSYSGSGAPPVFAKSVAWIFSALNPRARRVIDGKSSVRGGGSPLMNRSGFTRATTKALRYGLV